MKFLKWFLIIVVVLVGLFFFVIGPYMKTQTKKHSPQLTATYHKQGMNLAVAYSSPYKKGRVIFGELVPYGETWRTGANEPTTLTTETPIKLKGQNLPAGTYAIWTQPNAKSWTVYFNEKVPDWGVSASLDGMKPDHNSQYDIVTVEVPVKQLTQSVESFTIAFEEEPQLQLTLTWDTTKIGIPLSN